MLGGKISSKHIDNRLGRKLTTPINSLGSKLVKSVSISHHHNHNQQQEPKSYLEKR